MRDVDATIEQAKALGSEERLMAHEIVEIRIRAEKEGEPISYFDLITNAYNFGFTIGYRVGRGEKEKASADAPAE